MFVSDYVIFKFNNQPDSIFNVSAIGRCSKSKNWDV